MYYVFDNFLPKKTGYKNDPDFSKRFPDCCFNVVKIVGFIASNRTTTKPINNQNQTQIQIQNQLDSQIQYEIQNQTQIQTQNQTQTQ